MVALASAFVLSGSGSRTPPGASSPRRGTDPGRRCSFDTAGLARGRYCDRDPRTTSSSDFRCAQRAASGKSRRRLLGPPPSAHSPQGSGRTEQGCVGERVRVCCQDRPGWPFGTAAGNGCCTSSWRLGGDRNLSLSTCVEQLARLAAALQGFRIGSTDGSGSGSSHEPKRGECTQVRRIGGRHSARFRASRSCANETRLGRVLRIDVGVWRDPCSSPSSDVDGRNHPRNTRRVLVFQPCSHLTSRSF